MFRITKWFKTSKRVKKILLYGLFVLLVFSLWFSYSVYKQQRWNAHYAVNEMYHISRLTYEDLSRMEKREFGVPYNLQKRLHNLFEETQQIKRHFNFYEEKKNDINTNLYLNGRYFIEGLSILELRHKQDLWSQTDQKYYDKLLTYVENLSNVLKKEKEGFESTPLFAIFNVNNLSEQIEAINRLSYSYVSNHQVSEVKTMSQEKMKEMIARQVSKSAKEIRIDIQNTSDEFRSEYDFEIDGEMHGEVSPYTGLVTKINYNSRENPTQDLSKEDAKQSAVSFLNHIFEGDYNYKITYNGINHNRRYSGSGAPDIQLHSFYAIPLNGEYPYLQPFHNKFGIYIDKHTGEIGDFHITSIRNKTNNFFSNEFFTRDFKLNVSKKEAAKKLKLFKEKGLLKQHNNIEKYSYNNTGIIYSQLSGEFELVHEFRGMNKSDLLFVNATDGYLDQPYEDF